MTLQEMLPVYEKLREERINNRLMNVKSKYESSIKVITFNLQHGSSMEIKSTWDVDPLTGKTEPMVVVAIIDFCNEPELMRLVEKHGSTSFRIMFDSLHRRDSWVEKFMKRCRKIPTPYQRRKLRAEAAKLSS